MRVAVVSGVKLINYCGTFENVDCPLGMATSAAISAHGRGACWSRGSARSARVLGAERSKFTLQVAMGMAFALM